MDFVGYGSANCSEGSPASGLSNTTALFRVSGGCNDTDNNAADFLTAPASPRNSASPSSTCDGSSAGGIVPTPTIGLSSMTFPHFAQGGGFQTTFTFNNLSASPAAVMLLLFSQSGESIGSAAIMMSAYGSAHYAMTGSTLSVGWAKARLILAAHVVGTETIQLFDSGAKLVTEGSVLPAQPGTTIRMPVYEKSGFGTGVAIVNAGTTPSTVTLNVRNPAGVVVNTGDFTLAPSEQTARYVSELFPWGSDSEKATEPEPLRVHRK